MPKKNFLRKEFGEEFKKWADSTPCFFPDFSKWTRSERSFSGKKVLKDEYSGFFAIIATFTFLEVVGDLIVSGEINFDWEWCFLFIAGLLTYLTLRIMKKKGMLEAHRFLRGHTSFRNH